jgi:hypothetical protein
VSSPDVLASDAEREQVAERLRAAAGEGRLTAEELSERLGHVYAARTHGELAAATAGLPQVRTPRPRVPARRRIERELAYVATPVVACILVWLFTGADSSFWPKWVILAALLRLVFRARWALLGPRR